MHTTVTSSPLRHVQTNRAMSIMGRNNIWVWESPSGDRQDRRLSIHNLASGRLQAPIYKSCPGDPVTCMAKVGPYMWVGVQVMGVFFCIRLHFAL